MNNDQRNRLTKLEEMIGIQTDCINPSDPNSRGYMHGMLNGMIYSHSIISGLPPDFYVLPKAKRRTNRVRHKGKK